MRKAGRWRRRMMLPNWQPMHCSCKRRASGLQGRQFITRRSGNGWRCHSPTICLIKCVTAWQKRGRWRNRASVRRHCGMIPAACIVPPIACACPTKPHGGRDLPVRCRRTRSHRGHLGMRARSWWCRIPVPTSVEGEGRSPLRWRAKFSRNIRWSRSSRSICMGRSRCPRRRCRGVWRGPFRSPIFRRRGVFWA